MEKREERIRRWFAMWLRGKDLGIEELFTPDAVYVESWGPRYEGAERIRHWFREWNTRGRVVTWEIRQFFHKGDQTVVEWFFRNRMDDGREEVFDGLSLLRWSDDGKIAFLKEYGCNIHNYDPYENGPEPVFRREDALWF